MSKLELQTGYIADAILEVKSKIFKENFTTFGEVNIIKQVIERKIQQRKLKVKFVNAFFKRYFNITNGVITKEDKETASLRNYISDLEVRGIIYDEQTINICLCEIMKTKIQKDADQSFYAGKAKIVIDNDGYVKEAVHLSQFMWSNPNQKDNLIGTHITELAKILKRYATGKEVYVNFLEGVVLEFYKNKENREKQDLVENIFLHLNQFEEQGLVLKKTAK